MDIGKFIDEFVATKDSGAKERLVKKHVTKTYLSYAKKIEEAKRIVKYSCYDADGKYMINSPLRFMLFIISVINNYTDLKFVAENTVGQFDLLMSNGVVDVLVPIIGGDYSSFETVLNMVFDDEQENNRSIVSFTERKAEALLTMLDAMSEMHGEKDNADDSSADKE